MTGATNRQRAQHGHTPEAIITDSKVERWNGLSSFGSEAGWMCPFLVPVPFLCRIFVCIHLKCVFMCVCLGDYQGCCFSEARAQQAETRYVRRVAVCSDDTSEGVWPSKAAAPTSCQPASQTHTYTVDGVWGYACPSDLSLFNNIRLCRRSGGGGGGSDWQQDVCMERGRSQLLRGQSHSARSGIF